MNTEEIKETYSMSNVVSMYDIRIERGNFCKCPFHSGDHTASLKIYDKSFFCFGCGATGDIFTFVQKMENCDFKEAFYKLGGGYSKNRTLTELKRIENLKKAKTKAQIEEEKKKKLHHDLCMRITAYQNLIEENEPFSDIWCFCKNKLEYALYCLENFDDYFEYSNRKEVRSWMKKKSKS